MASRINFKLIIISLVIAFGLSSCEKSNNPAKKFPTTTEEITESVKTTKRLAEESSILVDDAIAKAYDQGGFVNPNEIAKSIESIDGVLSATPTASGTGIVIQQDDSTFSNILIVTKDDERLYKITKNKSLDENGKGIKNSEVVSITPNGNKIALILAPFQNSFKTDLNNISGMLQSAGYSVEKILDSNAALKFFKGTALINYDVVYIITHGLADGETWGKTKSTLLMTGEKVDPDKFLSLPPAERNALAIMYTVDGTAYYAISVPYINLTTKGTFTNTWIFADACESAEIDNGPTSLSEAFLKLGAGGYNGYDGPIGSTVSNPAAEEMTSQFISGLSLTDASNNVRKDPYLLNIKWTIGIGGIIKSFDITSFDDNQLTTDPFYLFETHDKIIDIDGNSYNIGTLGTQIWMLENLKTTENNDGTLIPQSTGGYVWYNFNIQYKNTYGAYYNFSTVKTGKLCPSGWHVPTYYEWETLINYLISSGYNYDGSTTDNKVAKSLATAMDWKVSFVPGTPGSNDYPYKRNATGFSAMPASGCFVLGGMASFGAIGEDALWWSSTEYNENGAWFAQLPYRYESLVLGNHLKENLWSVRCVKDN